MLNKKWYPSSSVDTLKVRANLLFKIRKYFFDLGVIEVDTPVLSQSGTVDTFIESFATEFFFSDETKRQTYYLHTSPEFLMKRLLAYGMGDIFYLGKVFRNGEIGHLHNPEFTMLEYYRLSIDDQQLMDDLSQFLQHISLHYVEKERISYGEIFEKYLDVNPYIVTHQELLKIVNNCIEVNQDNLSFNDCLDLLFSQCIQCKLPKSDDQLLAVYIYDYPESMSALSRIEKKTNYNVSKRFELFINGIELASGYYELLDGSEQETRFKKSQRERVQLNKKEYPFDEKLIQALENGMPGCSGVAVGIDRLLMLLLKESSIDRVIHFGFNDV